MIVNEETKLTLTFYYKYNLFYRLNRNHNSCHECDRIIDIIRLRVKDRVVDADVKGCSEMDVKASSLCVIGVCRVLPGFFCRVRARHELNVRDACALYLHVYWAR